MKYELKTQKQFDEIKTDIWTDENGDIYMTINQIAECLEYDSKSGIENILSRNQYLKTEEFSTTHVLGVVEGNRTVKRKTRIFNEDGIYEIAFKSNQPKAQAFRKWFRSVLKEIRKTGSYNCKQPCKYQYILKTFKGEEVVTLDDISNTIYMSRGNLDFLIKRYLKLGVDYRLLVNEELAAFKLENPNYRRNFAHLIVVYKNGFKKLEQIFNKKSQIQLFESKPVVDLVRQNSDLMYLKTANEALATSISLYEQEEYEYLKPKIAEQIHLNSALIACHVGNFCEKAKIKSLQN